MNVSRNISRYCANLCFPVWFAVLIGLSCSASESAGTTVQQNTSGGTSGGSVSGGSGAEAVQSNIQQSTCEPRGQIQACYCLDGSLSGNQECDENGRLTPCVGCPEVVVTPNEGGSLCPQLQAAVDCVAEPWVSDKLHANILFVVDRSSSMNCNTPDIQSTEDCENVSERASDQYPSKWEITTDALKNVFQSLDSQDVSAGLMFFSNNNVCGVNWDLTMGGVPIDRITASQIGLLSSALDRQQPQGGTPLVGATIQAYKHLHQIAGGDCDDPPCGANGNRFVVLITDGADSCPDLPEAYENPPCGSDSIACTKYLLDSTQPDGSVVERAASVNVRTFVIGAPGSEPARGFLSELAYQGETARVGCNHNGPEGETGDCHFDMTETEDFAQDLSDALRAISGSALGCEYPVPTILDGDPNNVNVQYTLPGETPVCMPRDDTAACDQGANGWQFAKKPDGSDDLSKVLLCGEYCDRVKQNSGAIQVDIIVGCLVVEIV